MSTRRRRGRNELVAARELGRLDDQDRLDELGRPIAELAVGLARALDDALANHAAGAKGYTVDRIARAYLAALVQLRERVPSEPVDDEMWAILSAPLPESDPPSTEADRDLSAAPTVDTAIGNGEPVTAWSTHC